ncbi:uncharacterized protein LOC131662888 [Phymastichus coffea]|uniref:uncharacterized protein LOC131662888 n=1 Tax=Phymastichus coffea TaxID=108790 RepID=UPI00273A852C|nr:uncharacterized protein LOC131662888 [Phymastichus coffea]
MYKHVIRLDSAFYRDTSGTSAIIEGAQTFGDRSPESEYYDTDEDDYTSRKRVRVRVPVIRGRTAKDHALTVVRRRPLVPYTKSLLYQPIESSLSSLTPRKIVVTRTKIRNYDSIDAGYHLGDEISNDLYSKNNRHKVTVTRRRKVRPSSTTVAPTQRERVTRVTRKKLVTIRPIPKPSATLAIITTGFYTAPSFEVEEEDEESFDYDYSPISTPVLHGSYITRNDPIPSFTTATNKLISSRTRSSTATDPIIITDNFFFPSAPEEPTTNSYYEYDNAKNDTIDESEDENLEQKPTSETPDVTDSILTTLEDVESTTAVEEEETTQPMHDNEDYLKVIPIRSYQKIESTPTDAGIDLSLTSSAVNQSEIPTVIPLVTDLLPSERKTAATPASTLKVTTSSPSLTTEDIEAGLTDELYLSLSRLDFPQIVPSKVENEGSVILSSSIPQSSQVTPELETSVYYTETVVTSTRLRTYTYVVTKLNGQETEVTSSTSIRPRVTTLTLTVPVTVTVTPTLISSSVALNSSLAHKKNEEVEDEGRKFNLATRVMSNGVEVIVAGTTPAYRWENSNPQPTLTLSEAVLMLMPQDKPNDFVTKTCMTTFTYLNTILRDGTTIVSTDQQVIANTATEERHRKRPAEAASVTLDASPTLQTEVFKTTYTYLTLNSDHPDEKNALGSSTKVITNIVTAPQYYLEMILEPSETPRPETNTYLSTRALEKTYVEEGKTKIEMTTDVVTQLIITESSVPPPRATSLTTPSPVADESISPTTDIAKTYYITYTYFNTYLENDSTVVKTNIATSSDIIYEKAPSKKSSTKSIAVSATPEPIQIFATKTYLTTFTYFTTLLQAGLDGETSTTISSRTKIVENVVTESIAPSLLDAGYMNALLTTSHHSDTLKNVVTGSTIIFFDDEEQVTPTSAAFDTSASAIIDKIDAAENTSTSPIVADSVGAESNDVTTRPLEQDNEAAEETTDPPPSKKPSQVSNLLSLGSLGINSLSALGPVITAMAGLLQGKSSATRRNDTESVTELPTTTTQRSPIYIPVGEFADGDIETAESQNIAHHLANSNVLTETRHKVAASLDGGIAISPGEIITANSDVIIGKPGKMAPRPPQTFLNEENIGMKPPPVSVPNIPVHPVLEVVEREPVKPVKIQKGSQQLEIYPSHQIYEEHIQVPITYDQPNFSKRPQNIHENIHIPPVNRISSKKDILENDPLLIPPSVLLNSEKHRHMDKHRRPWSAKDPIPQANVLIDDKNRLGYAPIDIGSGIQKKEYVPEPIVHQVPHVIDRSTGQPLLVNIQPSQVANVVIPQGGTQALIFGDTPEPHKSGQYFDDPSPYPEPEVGPGFIGIDKVENLPQFSKNDNPSDYMTPPSPTLNLKPLQNSNSGNRPHVIPLSTNQDHKKYSQVSARPEKIPIRHHDTSSLSSGGQGHVHTEILVHHGGESGQTRPLSSARPPIPVHNYQNIQHPPRKDYTKIHMAVEQTPPRRTEVPSENSYYDQQLLHANVNWNSNKNEKKPLRPSQVRWARPTSRPSRPPTKITGRPYGRPSTRLERPSGSIRPPQFTQRLPTTTYYQNEQQKFNQQPPTSIPFGESNQQTYMSGPQDKPQHYYQDNYTGINLQITTNHTVQDYKGDSLADQINLGLGYKSPSVDEIESDSKIIEKPMDSDVEASEDIKISTGLNDKPEDDIIITEDSDKNKFETTITFDQDRVDENGDGEIIMGSEKKQDQYLAQSTYGEFNHMNNNHHNVYVTDTGPQQNMTSHTQFIDLQSPVVNPSIEPNGHSRPFLKSHFSMTLSDNKPDIITESPDKNDEIVHGHIKPGLGQVLHVQNDKNEYETRKNDSRTHIYRRPKPDFPSRIHADRPEIITKPKLKTPRPVVVSSGKIRKQNNYRKPQVQFSLPIDSTGEENDSKTQTERPPSSDTTNYHKKPTQESLDTAFQTNFASDDHKDEVVNDRVEADGSFSDTQKISDSKSKLLPQDMVPPPVTPVVNKDILKNDEGLKPPPLPTVLGLTPPPVDITTTTRPIENNPKVNAEVSGLKPPPLYIPLQESSTPLQPSVDMVPPSPRPSLVRPFLADVLSQDMVPPPPDVKTTRPLEIATIRPGVAVSGSIQIDTAVATSHIPVVQDMESKIPIVHGTVDLPVVVDVPEFLKPIDNKKPDHVSVYTVRPFETRQRHTTPPTISPSKTTSVAVTKQTQVKNNERVHEDVYVPTRLSPSDISIKPSKQPELIIDLEPSTDIHMPSSGIEATESLNIAAVNTKRTKQRSSVTEVVTKAPPVVVESSQVSKNTVQQSSSSTQGAQATRKTDLKIKQSASKMMEIIGTVVHEFIQNSTNEQVETQPHEVTRFETLTVTRTETLVLGSPPTTRTLLITHTLTSTRVETVTETLLRPTSVISTIISTILQSATHVPTYENDNTDNESIFVVMSDHTPPAAGAEEVEAEYGEEDVSRDEEDNSVNEIHRVLQGGILEAPSVPIRPPKIQCLPECKGFKSEVCAESATGETRCICRPGFARMFPDRPCKPTYTFTLGVGLERLGRDRFIYDPAMNDTNSIAFRRYAHPIKEALDRTLMQSDLRDAYRAANIVGFTVKPSKVMFNVQLSSNTDETHLKDVLRKYLVLSNYSLGGTDVYASKDLGLIEANDFDECTNEEGGPHHDCSVNAACFNLKGTYQCSCKEGFADLSENPTYPGRLCSQAPLGCAACNNKGHCLISSHGQEVCECFPWYSGQKCQVNLKVLLIGLVTTGAILLGLLAVCVGMACCRNPVRRRGAGDRRAMIAGGGGDTSSEGSVAELALPHHVPHILPPPPQMIAPQPPLKKVAKKVSGKTRRAPRKPAPLIAPVPSNVSCLSGEQRDRSMTVMIPRAKYRATSQQSGPLPPNYKPMSSFAVDEHKLIDYLESGPVSAHRKPSLASEPDYKEQSPIKMQPAQQSSFATSGALVSAGFQVSATVTRAMDAESTLGRSYTETTVEPATKLVRVSDFCDDLESTMVRSCAETTIQASTKQLLRLELADAGSTLARSCGETTIQPPTRLAERNSKDRDLTRDSASEGHTMAERDLGSTLRLPAQRATLYNQDRTTSSDRESNFDSL